MNIVIISGSTRTGRLSHQATVELHRRMALQGISAEIIDLAEYNLPMLEDTASKHKNPPPLLATFAQKLDAADAMVFVSPEYHGSYSGALKNALDYVWKEFSKKPIGVVTATTGKFGGINASTQMQLLILSLGAFPMPYKLLVPDVDKAFDASGTLTNETTAKSFEKFISEFMWFAKAIVAPKKQNR
ncbi:MAG: NADPH-dependent oxidoreductase [Cytophagales bacterium]|nr:MAG: NADPH-dependent oxidoreductase [Cytophagales bacterium]